MTNNENATPEEVDAQNQHLIQGLHRIYSTNDEDAQSLVRIRQRLVKNDARIQINSRQAWQQPVVEKIRQERPRHINSTEVSRSEGRSWQQRLSTIAAVVFAALLVGSLLLLLTHARQNGTGSGGKQTPTPNVVIAPPTIVPASTFGRGWKLVAQFKGTGSKSITGQNIAVTQTWGAWFTCMGKGYENIIFSPQKNGLGGGAYGSDCHLEANGHLNFIAGGISPQAPIQKIDIIVNKSSAWQLQVAICIDESICGRPYPTPTPSPTAVTISTPEPPGVITATPKPTQPGEPTPTPSPTPKP